jgi:hypothetical protein
MRECRYKSFHKQNGPWSTLEDGSLLVIHRYIIRYTKMNTRFLIPIAHFIHSCWHMIPARMLLNVDLVSASILPWSDGIDACNRTWRAYVGNTLPCLRWLRKHSFSYLLSIVVNIPSVSAGDAFSIYRIDPFHSVVITWISFVKFEQTILSAIEIDHERSMSNELLDGSTCS